jgi:hypothetical protein
MCRQRLRASGFAASAGSVAAYRAPARQRRRDSLQELRGQVDFRNEQQSLMAPCDAARCCCKVNLGLAAPRNPVQQKRRETSMRLRNRSDRALLLRIECS